MIILLSKMRVVLWTAFFLVTICHVGICSMNFAQNKWATQSSTLNYSGFLWTADKAVDGEIGETDPDRSKTCSATDVSLGNHTWSVDFGFSIVVKKITVYGRSDGQDQLSDLKVFIENVGKTWTDERKQTVYTFFVNDSLARFITVMREDKVIMTICAVIVEGECQKGTFGEVCNETCGNCLNGNISCISTTGHCIGGCQQGWRGKACKHQCSKGAYGRGCNEICGMCFGGKDSCSTVDGVCEFGCEAGWWGSTCNQECEKGTYGYGCNEACGNCMYGVDSCSTINGTCFAGCQDGWKNEKCKQGTMADEVPNVCVVVGSVATAVGILIIAILFSIVIVKKRRKKNKKETGRKRTNIARHASEQTLYVLAINETTYSAAEDVCPKRDLTTGETNTYINEMELHVPDQPVPNQYEDLRDVPDSARSDYATIDNMI